MKIKLKYVWELERFNLTFNKSLLSVIICIYNKEQYLNRCFNSLLNQSLFRMTEIVFVDDKSIDKSQKMILDFQSRYDNVKFFQHKKNSGTHRTRIDGVLFSTGEYLMTLDPDDEFYSEATKMALSTAMITGADVIQYDSQWFNEKNETLWKFDPDFFDTNRVYLNRILNSNEEIRDIFFRRKISNSLWIRIIRASVYRKAIDAMSEEMKDSRLNFGEDILHIGYICLYAQRMIMINNIGYLYYLNNTDNSLSGKYQNDKQNNDNLQRIQYFLNKSYPNIQHVI